MKEPLTACLLDNADGPWKTISLENGTSCSLFVQTVRDYDGHVFDVEGIIVPHPDAQEAVQPGKRKLGEVSSEAELKPRMDISLSTGPAGEVAFGGETRPTIVTPRAVTEYPSSPFKKERLSPPVEVAESDQHI